jgi:hypothetical protein
MVRHFLQWEKTDSWTRNVLSSDNAYSLTFIIYKALHSDSVNGVYAIDKDIYLFFRKLEIQVPVTLVNEFCTADPWLSEYTRETDK